MASTQADILCHLADNGHGILVPERPTLTPPIVEEPWRRFQAHFLPILDLCDFSKKLFSQNFSKFANLSAITVQGQFPAHIRCEFLTEMLSNENEAEWRDETNV